MTYDDILARYVAQLNEAKAKSEETKKDAEKAREAAMRYYRIAAQKMTLYNKLYDKSLGEEFSVCWVRDLLPDVIKEVNERTGLNFYYENLNTYGLRCECPTHARDEKGKWIASLTFTPSFSDKVGLFIDTGNTKSDFGNGTIGEINGFNNEEEEVVSIDTIIENLKRRYPDLKLNGGL